MMGNYRGGGMGSHESEQEKMEQEVGEWEHSEHSELSEQDEQELSRLTNTTPQRVFWIVVGMALLLLLIVNILGAYVFHFW